MNDFLLHDEFETDIDLTPLIDVIFMLLLFFILASTFSVPVLRVALPKAVTASPSDSAHDRLILTVDQDGILHGGSEPIALDDLASLLATHTEGPVELRVDRVAPFHGFVTVLDKIREAGRNDVLISAQPEE